MAYIYAQYTNRNFVVRSTSILDIAIFTCVVIWFEKYEEYVHDYNDGFGLTDPPHEYHIFMKRLLDDVNTGKFHFDWLLSITAFLFWIRLIFMMQLTKMFGPLIRTTVAMMKDLVIFFLLFTIQLIAFSCVGILSFGNLEDYETLQDAFIMFFTTSMGEWDFSIYDELGPTKRYYGIGFHIVVIAANTMLLLNLVIAIMTSTYAVLSDVKLGLYSQGVIEAVPSYKNNKRFGGLIVMIPPFNLLAYLLLPIYHCKRNDREYLTRFNSKVCKTVYFPIGFFFGLVFFASSLVMTPIAWVKVIIHKCMIAKRTKKRNYYGHGALYGLLGLPLLVCTAFVDFYWFFKHLYQWQMLIV